MQCPGQLEKRLQLERYHRHRTARLDKRLHRVFLLDILRLEAYTLNTHPDPEEVLRRRKGQLMTTLAISQTLHAHISFQVSVLESMLARQDSSAGSRETVVCIVGSLRSNVRRYVP